jgi:threonine dehydrogenase-like Zn-dependent dehydrogenase
MNQPCERARRQGQNRLLKVASWLRFHIRKGICDYCRDSDARLCGLKELAFEYAVRNGTDGRFNKEKKTPGKEYVIYSAKDEICQPLCQKNAALEKLQAKMKFK